MVRDDTGGMASEPGWFPPRLPNYGLPGNDDQAPNRGWRMAWKVAACAVAVLVVAGFVAARWVVPYYAVTPGTALNVAGLISVPRGTSHSHQGSIVLTDVELVHLTALGYLYYRFEKGAQIVSATELTGGSSSAAYNEEGVIEMATARQAAVLVALRQLGYHPRAVPAGVVVFAIQPGASPASTLAVGDVVTAVGSTRTAALGPLASAVGKARPGSSIRLSFHRWGSAAPRTKTVVVGELKRSGTGSATTYTCVPAGSPGGGRVVRREGGVASCLPFYPEQLYRNEGAPFRISINPEGIVGPSAGLSFTLGVIDKLDRGDLTAGRRVAATGTISNDGSVGAIGGIAQKTTAVREAGASVFLVPPSNASVARANAGPHLRVIAVASIGQAVTALEGLGGKLVPATTAG